VRFLDGVPVFVEVSPKEGFQVNPDDVRKAVTNQTRTVLINSPSNPTGIVMEQERMKDLAALGIPLISDEIYHGLVYEGKEHSVLEFTKNAFVINGFSKLYAMTGWRLGYVIAPPEFVRPIQKMGQNFFISASDFVQYAGLEALTNSSEETQKMKETFNQRRLAMIPRLKEMGFGIEVDPTAAFYVLADARRFSGDSYRFAFDILEEARVGVAPGIDFGNNAEGFIRFSYTNSLENILAGLDRIELYLRTRFGPASRKG
jgi:aspartate/methionine/tyrosine aminotransferase